MRFCQIYILQLPTLFKRVTNLIFKYSELNFFTGILIAKKPIFRRHNTCDPDGFFAFNEHTDKVSVMNFSLSFRSKKLLNSKKLNYNNFSIQIISNLKLFFQSFDIQEEGSCAALVESIRAGLVMQLKETVSVTNIVQRQEKINK